MRSCLSARELQGYLEDRGYACRARVERHLVECANCRGRFDRLAATNQRVNVWLSALASPMEAMDIDVAGAMQDVMTRGTPVPVNEIRGPYVSDLRSRLISVGIHLALLSLALYGFSSPEVRRAVKQKFDIIDPNLKPYLPQRAGAHGGAREAAPVTAGRLPRPSTKQFVPPMISDHIPKLAMDPSMTALPDAPIPSSNLNDWGDPLAKLMNGSSGNGFGGGMGSGSGGFGGGVFKAGGGVSAPVVLFRVDPQFSEEARKAKYGGTVVLVLVVDREGHARDIHVVKSLGMGLDEKAIEAVQKWRFRPGMKGGLAVNVQAQVEVYFHLL